MPAFADIDNLCLDINIGASATPGPVGAGTIGHDPNASVAMPARRRVSDIVPGIVTAAVACEQVSTQACRAVR